jgi:DNA-binding MarR family transcriptional regulator
MNLKEKDSLEQDSRHTLPILDEVAKGKPLTQRDLSRKLGIALGMTNNYLKRLTRQGYIQMVRGEKNRLQYLLTPLGISEKSVLAYRYIRRSYQVFSEARERIRLVLADLEKKGVKTVILYKATVVAEIAMLALQDSHLDLLGIVDPEKTGNPFLGHAVLPGEALRELDCDMILITTEEPIEKVAKQLEKYGIGKEKICRLG